MKVQPLTSLLARPVRKEQRETWLQFGALSALFK